LSARMPSILHVGSIAGVPQELSKAQRRLGQKSDVISFQPHPFHYDVDFYRPTKLPFPLRYLERLYYMFQIMGDYDILHFHYFSLFPFGWDLPIWKALGKKIVMHHHGDDIRNKGEGWLHARLANAILVSTPDLLAWSPRAKWIPNPIDLGKFEYAKSDDRQGSLKIVHAPSVPKVKGTEHVRRAAKELQAEGYDIELVQVVDMPHQEAVKLYRNADIAVDQLLVGWYGVFAIECMALGKPVCVFIKEELKSRLRDSPLETTSASLPKEEQKSALPDLPLVSTSASQLKEDLKKLIKDDALRKRVGSDGRRFVEMVHNADEIARYLMDKIY
jgi:glycosyltransferase involved in cell wall biosynthesis